MIQDNKKIPKKIKDILIQNPHWITNDLDLLNQIIDSENKKNTGNVVDLRDIFLKKTKSKLEKLSKIHTHTIAAAYENFLGANNLHRCIIKILEQNKLEELIHILCDDIKNILKCSETALLVSNQYEKFLKNPNFFNVANEEIQEITKSAKLTKNSLAKLNTNSQNLCISHYLNKRASKICSEAVLYLNNDSNYNNKAILIFGSTNKKLFNETNKTDYLNVLAKVISIQFNNLMDYKNERKAQNNF